MWRSFDSTLISSRPSPLIIDDAAMAILLHTWEMFQKIYSIEQLWTADFDITTCFSYA